MNCIRCNSTKVHKNGSRDGKQQYKCNDCGKYFQIDSVQEEPQDKQKKRIMGLTENELRAKHDVRFQVSMAIKNLKPSNYLSDAEFVTMAKIKPGQGYRSVIDHPDFDKYKGKAGSTTYWGHADSIAKLKEEGVLQ